MEAHILGLYKVGIKVHQILWADHNK